MIEIFKLDSKGRLRTIQYETKGNKIIQRSGLVGGNLKEDVRECQGKNIGKANETTPEEQAKLEMQSKIEQKVKKEYFHSAEEARRNANAIYPMLAKDFEKESSKVDWETAFIQPKLDGMRCLAFVENHEVKLMSRSNTPITTVEHIEAACSNLPDGVYDGELYKHGVGFQENMRLVKKYRPGETESVKLHLYDFVSNEPFFNRKTELLSRFQDLPGLNLVETFSISENKMKLWHQKFMSQGYEGSIIRHGTAGYKSKGRSSNLLKYKQFQDMLVDIRDVIPGTYAKLQGTLVCGVNGKSFNASIKGTHSYREQILANKEEIIGKKANIRFFELTDDGIPRFPVAIEIV